MLVSYLREGSPLREVTLPQTTRKRPNVFSPSLSKGFRLMWRKLVSAMCRTVMRGSLTPPRSCLWSQGIESEAKLNCFRALQAFQHLQVHQIRASQEQS